MQETVINFSIIIKFYNQIFLKSVKDNSKASEFGYLIKFDNYSSFQRYLTFLYFDIISASINSIWNNGVGRIRTSGLQRPRLASYQARQRPHS